MKKDYLAIGKIEVKKFKRPVSTFSIVLTKQHGKKMTIGLLSQNYHCTFEKQTVSKVMFGNKVLGEFSLIFHKIVKKLMFGDCKSLRIWARIFRLKNLHFFVDLRVNANFSLL